jgi:hypothetical protein
MSSPFAITTATNTVSLDGNRQGQTSFTVSNTTGHAIRGRTHLVIQPSNAEPWLRMQGEEERDFANAGSQQYVVQITVPPATAAGDYTFRLDVVDLANPDDNFSEGPTVKFVVPAPVPTKKPFPWWIVAVVVAILILIGAGTYGIVRLSHKNPVAAPTAPVNKPTPTPTLPVLSTGIYQGNFTNDDGTTFTIELKIESVSNEQSIIAYFFEGEIAEDVVNGTVGNLNQFNSAARNRLQYAIKLSRNTGTFVEFINSPLPPSTSGNTCIQVQSCLFDAVVYPDGSLHGVFFYTSTTPQPDGTFVFTKIQGLISTDHILSLIKAPVLAGPRDAYIRDIAVH